MEAKPARRRPILGILAIFLLFFLYRVFTVYTVRSGECTPKPVDPELRLTTRDERGKPVSFPERVGYPKQTKPLLVMSYNIAGHDELHDADHLSEVAAVINSVKPDIVGLNEVHRGTWQVRFRDQVANLQKLTGMRAFFGPSYENFGGHYGNAILTRGEILSTNVHELPSIGEPRSVTEAVVRIDGATINFYVTHLVTWGGLNRATRNEQLQCLARHVRTSRYPYLLVGDLNAPPESPEIVAFREENAAQICGEDLGDTQKVMKQRLDYIFADYGWHVRSARVLTIGGSDHWPVIAELFWEKQP